MFIREVVSTCLSLDIFSKTFGPFIIIIAISTTLKITILKSKNAILFFTILLKLWMVGSFIFKSRPIVITPFSFIRTDGPNTLWIGMLHYGLGAITVSTVKMMTQG